MAAERARFDRILSVIKNAPEDGKFYALAPDNTRLLQMTGANMHVIYAVKYWPIGRVLPRRAACSLRQPFQSSRSSSASKAAT